VTKAAIAVIDTSSVAKNEGRWDAHAGKGLFRAVTVAIWTTYLRTCDDSRHIKRVENCLRNLLPIKVTKTSSGENETHRRTTCLRL